MMEKILDYQKPASLQLIKDGLRYDHFPSTSSFIRSVQQATAHCQEAKDYLEMMCRDLASELANFDYQKEQELRSVFLEYAALFCEKFQRVRKCYVGRVLFFVISSRASGTVLMSYWILTSSQQNELFILNIQIFINCLYVCIKYSYTINHGCGAGHIIIIIV